MTTETLTNSTQANETQPNPKNTKTWLAIGAMFIAGVGGGVLALSLLSPRDSKPRFAVEEGQVAMAPASQEHNNAPAGDAATQEEIRVLREEVDLLRAATKPNVVSNNATELVDQRQPVVQQRTTPAAAGQRTLAYWNKLNSIMSREAAMRAAPPQLTAGNAMSFVSSQSSAYEYAASAIRQLGASGVDPQVAAIGREIAAWYDEGIANSRSAESLLGSDDIAARQGSAGQGWSSAEKKHRETCLAINRRGEQLRQELTRKYGLEFPPLQ